MKSESGTYCMYEQLIEWLFNKENLLQHFDNYYRMYNCFNVNVPYDPYNHLLCILSIMSQKNYDVPWLNLFLNIHKFILYHFIISDN